jgi:hypothetical protein
MFCFYHCFDDYTKAKNSWHMPFSACLDKINPCDCSGKQTNFPLNHSLSTWIEVDSCHVGLNLQPAQEEGHIGA